MKTLNKHPSHSYPNATVIESEPPQILITEPMQNSNLVHHLIPSCQFCHKSEDQSLCEILQDDSKKCKLLICLLCLRQFESTACLVCGNKLRDHRKKLKNTFLKKQLEKGMQQYNTMHSERMIYQKLQHVDEQTKNLLMYFHKFGKDKHKFKVKEIQKLNQQLQKSKDYVKNHDGGGNKNYPVLKGTFSDLGDGKIGSGWRSESWKGIKMIVNAFNKNPKIPRPRNASNNTEEDIVDIPMAFGFTMDS